MSTYDDLRRRSSGEDGIEQEGVAACGCADASEGGGAAAGPEGISPGADPVPLLHVDAGYKFHDMIAFRDACTLSLD